MNLQVPENQAPRLYSRKDVADAAKVVLVAPSVTQPRSPRSGADRNRACMIEKVRAIWIKGFLEKSLFNEVRIILGLAERPSAVASPFHLLVKRPDEGEQPLPPGTQVLDFVYIDDVIEAMLRADANARGKGGVATWNVATGQGHSVREFAETVARAMDADVSLLGFGAIEMRKDDEPWFVGSSDLLRNELGWQPPTGLEAGIRAAVAELRRT